MKQENENKLDTDKHLLYKFSVGAVSGSQVCPNCEKEHDSDEWNGYCSKICWWGFPIDCH